MTKQQTSKWFHNTTKVLVVAFVETLAFVGFRSLITADPVVDMALGLAMVYLTSKELL